MNHVTVIRSYLPEATVGFIDTPSKRLFTLERPWKENQGSVSCIPEGTYIAKRDHTGRHQYYAIQNVPNRTSIEIHVANYVTELEGCLSLGMTRMSDHISVGSSKDALTLFLKEMGDDDFLITFRAFNPAYDNI